MLTVNDWTLSPFSTPEMLTTRKRQRQLRHAASKENMVRELAQQQLQINQLVLQTQNQNRHQFEQPHYQLENAALLSHLPTDSMSQLQYSQGAQVFPAAPQSQSQSILIKGSSKNKLVVGSSGLVKKQPKKRVSFSPETKTWDGLLAIHDDFDELLYCFLIKGQSIGDGDILKWTSEDCQKIFSLAKLLNDLICRVRVACDTNLKVATAPRCKQVPCLPHGGGRAMRVEKAYEPYLVSLLSVLSTALSIASTNGVKKKLQTIRNPDDVELMQHLVKNKAALEGLVFSK